jgi:hypothetical protein
MNITKHKLTILMLSAALLPAASSYALDASHYADNSALATGKWAKVSVSGAGMQLITDTQLRAMGFDDPGKVHVYGTGGRQLTYGLTAANADDLPLLPSVRTQKGIVFFATDQVTWTRRSSASTTPYSHTMHEYSDETFYFLSDRDITPAEMQKTGVAVTGNGAAVTTFAERLLHESELETAGDFGSQIWGEDFRSKKSQTFSFALPDMADNKVSLSVRFAAKTMGGKSSIILTANGSRLPSTTSDNISSTAETEHLGNVTQTYKKVEGIDGKLDLGIDFSYSGTLYKARLDFIEVFYNRQLKLNKGEIYFYLDVHPAEHIEISGCSASTKLWDVTDPAHPTEVDFNLSGDKARFCLTSSGKREFVAFDPESISRGVKPGSAVANQDIHGLEVPDMVIITHAAYREGAEKIAALHKEHDGMSVHVVEADKVYNEFSGGKRDMGAFRRMLKMWHDRGLASEGRKIKYALLMGKAINDNKQVNSENKNLSFTPMPIWESNTGMKEEEAYCNDSWIGMLDDVQDAAFSMTTAKMHVAVGRIPCASSTEALTAANKIEKYLKEPQYGDWRNKVMIIADDEDGGTHLTQAERVHKAMIASGNNDGANRLYDKVYLDSYNRVMSSVGATYPQAKARMLNNFEEGVAMTNYIGHASARGWGHEHLLEWPDLTSLTNKKLTFIYASTCSFADIDKKEESGAENMLLNPEGGVIGIISATRSVYIASNGTLNELTMSGLFNHDEDGGPLRWGDIFVYGQNNINDSNSLRYIYLGDPAIRIPGGSRRVHITAINGQETDGGMLPEIEAMSSVEIEGEILNQDGSLATDFNGNVEFQLYDGERVITTYGHGAGAVMNYNDRDKRLSLTSTSVKGGKWSATLRVPPEIQNLYTTALISSYAWSDTGKEANGSYTDFYVYGFNESSPDTKGPDIEAFYVNSPHLGDGALVPSNMIVFARLRDESGINVSETGIGHSLTLCIDGKDYIDGLGAYYTQDVKDPNLGTITFPLNDVQPGRHTLTLTAWDNANNVSKAEVNIQVGASLEPQILDITASQNMATASVDFLISIDRPNSSMECKVSIFDLNGRRIRDLEETLVSDMESMLSTTWDLCDDGGNRVPRGIYIYRASLETPDGMYSSKSKKLAVSAAQTAQ